MVSNNLNSISDTVALRGQDTLAPVNLQQAGIARARAAAGMTGKAKAAGSAAPQAQARSGTQACAVARARIVASAASRVNALARQNAGSTESAQD